jgi:hypothetical protein
MTEAEELELLELEAEAAKAEAAHGPAQKEDEGLWGNVKEAGGKALEMVGRTLDYPGGLARVAYQGLQDIPYAIRTQIQDGEIKSVSKADDFSRALKGQAPTSEEYMDRIGIEPGVGRTLGGMAKDIALDPLTYMTLGAAPLVKQTAKAGKNLYKSGLKAIDEEAKLYNKAPVSELLMKEGVTGSAEQIQKRMDELAEGYKRERDYILKRARAGEVDMGEAMAPLMAKIQELRNNGHPDLKALADVFENDARKMLDLGAKEPEHILRELPVQSKFQGESQMLGDYVPPERIKIQSKSGEGLPVQGVMAKGKTILTNKGDEVIDPLSLKALKEDVFVSRPAVPASYVEPGYFKPGEVVPETFIQQKPQTVLDFGVIDPKTNQVVDRIAGPSPMKANSWKSIEYNKVGDEAYKEAAKTPMGKELGKAKARGLKEAVENAVERTTGKQSAEELKDLNDRLGRILTTKEKAAKEATKEIKKNNFTSVDGIIAGLGDFKTLAVKKAADLSNMTGPRTKVGKYMVDNADSLGLLEKNLLYSPWVTMKRYQDKPEEEK